MKLIPSAGVIAYERIYLEKKTVGGLTAPDRGIYGKILAVGEAREDKPILKVKEGSVVLLWPGQHSEVPVYINGVANYLCPEDAVAAVVMMS